MHLDPLAARRTQAGAPVVHGVHGVLGAGQPDRRRPGQRAARHPERAVPEIHLRRLDGRADGIADDDTGLQAKLDVEDLIAITIDLGYGLPSSEPSVSLSTHPVQVGTAPTVLGWADLPDLAGVFAAVPGRPTAEMFPKLADRIGAGRTQSCAALSAIVGMACPGAHSIFDRLDVRFVREPPHDLGTSFAVNGLDDRFRLVRLAVAGFGVAGAVSAYLRHPPVAQPALRELAKLAGGGGEFRDVTALVVGGSRGIGAVTARLIAAGGGRLRSPMLSARRKRRRSPGRSRRRSVRVLSGAALRLARAGGAADRRIGWPVDQLYYFATPPIFRNQSSLFMASRFAEFCRFYVDGFYDICRALHHRTRTLAAFYPSSVAVQEHPGEWPSTPRRKRRASSLCADMSRAMRNLRVVTARLPRILTDQPVTVVPTETADPIAVMLPIIREMSEPVRRAT